MAYQRKTRDRWDIETNYGYGWEVEDREYTLEDATRTFLDYMNNLAVYGKCGIRLVKHREKIT